MPLDATSIADGSVNDSEFQYLSGATSNIQTQLDALSGATPLTSYLASTVTYNNVDVLANTALSVTVAAATKYAINLLIHSSSAVAVGLQLDFGGTATVTSFIGEWEAFIATGDNTDPLDRFRVTAAGTDFVPTNIAAGDSFYQFQGSINVNAGGTFLVRGAQQTAQVGNTTILAGSTLILTPMS